jgi:hypothetical protein
MDLGIPVLIGEFFQRSSVSLRIAGEELGGVVFVVVGEHRKQVESE